MAAAEKAALANPGRPGHRHAALYEPRTGDGHAVDARSDIFSLGVVLYEMVTGKTAFTATGLATLAIQIAQAHPIPIDRSVRDCPRG